MYQYVPIVCDYKCISIYSQLQNKTKLFVIFSLIAYLQIIKSVILLHISLINLLENRICESLSTRAYGL
jgi:hypothetical protein